MPMHLAVDEKGRVASAGRTLARLIGHDPVGHAVFDLLHLRRPEGIADLDGLRAAVGRRLHLTVSPHDLRMVGIAVPAIAESGAGLLLNLSLGAGIVAAVRRFELSNGDFAPTDLTNELLFLAEANAAVSAEAAALSDRLRHAHIVAEERSFTDTLTGLRNRRGLDRMLEMLSQRRGRFSILALDLDRFKEVNDTKGHAAGDQVLRAVSTAMLQAARSADVVARTGGDEFVIILEGSAPQARLVRIAERLIAAAEQPIETEGGIASISASIGIAVSDDHPPGDVGAVWKAADAALYLSKKSGRGCWTMARHQRSIDPSKGPNCVADPGAAGTP